jgi:uncharacterized membrane protein
MKGVLMQRQCLFLAAAVLAAAGTGPDEPARKYQVVTPKDDGIIATAINGRGAIVGFEWVERKEEPGVIVQMPFFAEGKAMTYLPLLEGYTATFPAGLSEGGRVAGRASKPAPPGANVPMRNQAFVWEPQSGIRGLGTLPGDAASLACGISRDGRRVSGFSVGKDRIRACFWDQAGEVWTCQALPQASRLTSQTVVISGNGRCIAAVDGSFPCLWTEDSPGTWTRTVIGEAAALVPRAVNDAGTVVGVRYTRDGLSHAALWSRQGGYKVLDELPGYVRSEARSVNTEGVVVGMIDGPGGSKIGPNAFVFEAGRLRILDEAGPAFTDATAINDHGQVAGVFEKEEEVPAAQKPDTAKTPK